MIIILIANPGYAQQPPEEVWNKTYDSGNNNDDEINGVAVDYADYVYVTGSSNNGSNWDFRTINYDPDGNIIWDKTYDSGEDDEASGIAVDNAGNVYVAGFSFNGTDHDIRVIKYDSNGNVVWNKTYDSGKDDEAFGVAVDTAGNVYVTGYSGAASLDFLTIKYDKDGNVIWDEIYDSGENDMANGVAVDDAGNVYVAGFSDNGEDNDFRVIKYDKDGNIVWNKMYDSGDKRNDYASGVALDYEDNLYVVGVVDNSDICVRKYDKDGNIIWNKVYDSGEDDEANGVAVDDAGNAYVTGSSHNNVSYWDFLTIKYDSDGNVIWDKNYDGGEDDRAKGVAVDASGFVYVAGYSDNGNDDDFRTIKYRQFFSIFGQVTEEGSGVGITDVDVVISGAISDTVKTGEDGFYGFFDLPCGEEYTVTPYKEGYSFSPPSYTYSPLSSDEIDQNFFATSGISEADKVENPEVVQKGNRIMVVYNLNKSNTVNISVLNVLGSVMGRVDKYEAPGKHIYTFDISIPGVYFIKINTDNRREIRKVVITN